MMWIRARRYRSSSSFPSSSRRATKSMARNSLSRLELKLISFKRCWLGDAAPFDGVHLHDDGIGAVTLGMERKQRRVAHVAAIPVGLSVDHHGLEHVRQA